MLNGDEDGMRSYVGRRLSDGTEPTAVLDELSETVRAVGVSFERGEVFLPELMLAADAMEAGVAEVIPALAAGDSEARSQGVVVIATVKNDVHDIGKNIVASFLRASGFEVHDLGRDVGHEAIVDKAQEVSADIVAVSALLTSTMSNAKDVRRALDTADARPRYLFIVGGGSVTPEWAESIGADGTAENASAAAALCERLMEMKRQELDGVRPIGE